MRAIVRGTKDIFADIWIRCVLLTIRLLPGRPGNELIAPMRSALLILIGVRIGAKSQISPGLRVFRFGHISAGTGCRFGYDFQIWNFSKFEVGSRLLASHGVKVICGTHQVSIERKNIVGPVSIGDDVWLGAGVTVVGPARIGSGVIVGAHSFVSGNLEAGWIYAGTPARKIRRVIDHAELP